MAYLTKVAAELPIALWDTVCSLPHLAAGGSIGLELSFDPTTGALLVLGVERKGADVANALLSTGDVDPGRRDRPRPRRGLTPAPSAVSARSPDARVFVSAPPKSLRTHWLVCLDSVAVPQTGAVPSSFGRRVAWAPMAHRQPALQSRATGVSYPRPKLRVSVHAWLNRMMNWRWR